MPAIRKALKLAGLTLDEIDLVELNEAFAAQVLACLRELPIDPERLNVNGGAIALGHPLGCTGAKLTTTLLYEMRRRNARYGLVTMCVGGGMGAAGIFERLYDALHDRPSTSRSRKGGAWLLEDTPPADVFTPEKLTDEHRLIAQTTDEFIDERGAAAASSASRRRTGSWRARCSAAAASSGLLGIDVPEEYGGVDLDKASSLVVVEQHRRRRRRSRRRSAGRPT